MFDKDKQALIRRYSLIWCEQVNIVALCSVFHFTELVFMGNRNPDGPSSVCFNYNNNNYVW